METWHIPVTVVIEIQAAVKSPDAWKKSLEKQAIKKLHLDVCGTHLNFGPYSIQLVETRQSQQI